MTLINYALFAQDSYHRGDSADAQLPDIDGTLFDNGEIVGSFELPKDGFYAIAYDTGSEIVIAYRGTDEGFKDILNG